ncbi:MAG: response regulator [Lentisphaerales bacterium]|nr:response regulator [Lentisphaerales bacterium]
MEERYKLPIVDDLEINRRVLDSYLSKGYEVVVASGGVEVFDLIQKHEVEIALLDLNMPNVTGFELAEHIREMPVYSESPIIFITGAALDQNQVIKGLSIGFVD